MDGDYKNGSVQFSRKISKKFVRGFFRSVRSMNRAELESFDTSDMRWCGEQITHELRRRNRKAA